MKAIKKSSDNLVNVAKSICDVDFNLGRFVSDFTVIDDCITLTSVGRDSIGFSIIRLIPCNYAWRVTFSGNVLKLCIWL